MHDRESPYIDRGYEAVAANVRAQGYTGATAAMVREIHAAMRAGRCWPDLPHGAIGRLAEPLIAGAPALFEPANAVRAAGGGGR